MPAETASERFLRERGRISTENASMERQLKMLEKGGPLTVAAVKGLQILLGGETVANGKGIQDAHDLFSVQTKQGDAGTSAKEWKSLKEQATLGSVGNDNSQQGQQEAEIEAIPNRTPTPGNRT